METKAQMDLVIGHIGELVFALVLLQCLLIHSNGVGGDVDLDEIHDASASLADEHPLHNGQDKLVEGIPITISPVVIVEVGVQQGIVIA